MKPRPLSVAREAEQEVLEAAEWYETQSQGLGRAFIDLINQTLKDIVESPLRFPQVYRDIRRALLKRFPFGIFFRLRRDQVRILAVLHQSRDPGRWHHRR
jgi:toxin ParE1/3/4